MEVIEELPVKKQQQELRISQFIEQYQALNQRQQSIINSKFKNLPATKPKQIKLNNKDIKTLDPYLSPVPGSTKNLLKIESQVDISKRRQLHHQKVVQHQIKKQMKHKVDGGSQKYRQMLDNFNEQRAVLKKRFERSPEALFEQTDESKSTEIENKFRQRNKSVQPSIKGFLNKNFINSIEQDSIGKERRTSILP